MVGSAPALPATPQELTEGRSRQGEQQSPLECLLRVETIWSTVAGPPNCGHGLQHDHQLHTAPYCNRECSAHNQSRCLSTAALIWIQSCLLLLLARPRCVLEPLRSGLQRSARLKTPVSAAPHTQGGTVRPQIFFDLLLLCRIAAGMVQRQVASVVCCIHIGFCSTRLVSCPIRHKAWRQHTR